MSASTTDRRVTPGALAVPDVIRLEVDLGTRVLVTSDLHLRDRMTDASEWATGELVRLLDEWDGPGVLAMAGDVVELWAGQHPQVETALDAHPELVRAISAFAAAPDRQVIYLIGNHDGRLAWDDEQRTEAVRRLGCEVTLAAEIGVRGVAGSTVRMEHGHVYDPANAFEDPRDPYASPLGQHIVQEFLPSMSQLRIQMLDGLDFLTDPRTLPALISSRIFYRQVLRQARWFLLPFVVVLLLRLPVAYVVFDGELRRLRPFSRVLLIADVMFLSTILLLVLVAALLVRRWWRTASTVISEEQGTEQNGSTRAAAKTLVREGYAGYVCGHTHHAELTAVGDGFYANTGSGTRALDRVNSRIGMPAVFLPRLQTSWVDLRTGRDPVWSVTLTLGRRSLPGPTLTERLVARQAGQLFPEPTVVSRLP